MIIRGNAVGNIRPNWNQSDPEKPDYILGSADARAAVEAAAATADSAAAAAQAAGNAASAAQTAADSASAAASDACTLARSKADFSAAAVTLKAQDWVDGLQRIGISAVTEDADTCHVIPCTPDRENGEAYYHFGICCQSQEQGAVVFSCQELPDRDITVHLMILQQGGAA